jgi:hypothetical protein
LTGQNAEAQVEAMTRHVLPHLVTKIDFEWVTRPPPGSYGYYCGTIYLICESARSRSHASRYYSGYTMSCDKLRCVYDVEG